MPYMVDVVGYRADFSKIATDAMRDRAAQRIDEICEADCSSSGLDDRLRVLRADFPAMDIVFAVRGEDACDQRLYFVRSGEPSSVDEGSKPAPHFHEIAGKWEIRSNLFIVPPLDMRLVEGALAQRVKVVEAISSARNPTDLPDLLSALEHPSNQLPGAGGVRRALFRALSWHDTPAVRARLARALKEEAPEVVETIHYIAWRLPGLLDGVDAP